jgi:phosphorylcholine metabolism protein LicD
VTKEESLINLLRQIKTVLEAYNVEFWLECGTLLGAVRDGTFIPWEKDIDFGAWAEKVDSPLREKIANSLRQKNLNVWIAENHINIRKDDVYGDINFYSMAGEIAIVPMLSPKNTLGRFFGFWKIILMARENYLIKKEKPLIKRLITKFLVQTALILPTPLREKLISYISYIYEKFGSVDISWTVPSKYFFRLSSFKFYGTQFKVPEHPQDYLAYRYGKDWQTPKKDYHGLIDDRSFAINRHKQT